MRVPLRITECTPLRVRREGSCSTNSYSVMTTWTSPTFLRGCSRSECQPSNRTATSPYAGVYKFIESEENMRKRLSLAAFAVLLGVFLSFAPVTAWGGHRSGWGFAGRYHGWHGGWHWTLDWGWPGGRHHDWHGRWHHDWHERWHWAPDWGWHSGWHHGWHGRFHHDWHDD